MTLTFFCDLVNLIRDLGFCSIMADESSDISNVQQFVISWCGSFVERQSFRIVSGDSPESLAQVFSCELC